MQVFDQNILDKANKRDIIMLDKKIDNNITKSEFIKINEEHGEKFLALEH